MPNMKRIVEDAAAVTLVKGTAEHAELLYRIFTGTNTRRYSPVAKTSVAELAERLRQGGDSFAERALCYRFFGETDAVLFGTFVVKSIDWMDKSAEVGVSLLDEWQGRGLGSALVYKCVLKTFRESDIDRLWATVSENNAVCNAMMRRIGFDECGFYKDVFIINGEPVRQVFYQMDRERSCRIPV